VQQLSARQYISSDTSVSELNSISATVSIVFVLRNLVFFQFQFLYGYCRSQISYSFGILQNDLNNVCFFKVQFSSQL